MAARRLQVGAELLGDGLAHHHGAEALEAGNPLGVARQAETAEAKAAQPSAARGGTDGPSPCSSSRRRRLGRQPPQPDPAPQRSASSFSWHAPAAIWARITRSVTARQWQTYTAQAPTNARRPAGGVVRRTTVGMPSRASLAAVVRVIGCSIGRRSATPTARQLVPSSDTTILTQSILRQPLGGRVRDPTLRCHHRRALLATPPHDLDVGLLGLPKIRHT